MNFTYNVYILPLLIAALISLAVAVYAWSRRSAASAIALSLLALAIAEWSLGYALEIAGADLATKVLWGKLEYLGIATAPLFWLIFAFNHAHQGGRLSHQRMLLLSLIPALTILLAFTTEMHGWLWNKIGVSQNGAFSALDVGHGFWFWIHFAYSYLLLAVGAWIVLRSIGKMQGLYRGQAVALIVAVIAPWAANALYLSGNSPVPGLDITPFAFTLTVAGLAWGIFGFRLVDISPIARSQVVEAMRDGMIVLDMRGRVVDINQAAGRIIGLPATQAIGRPVEEIFSPWPDLLARFKAAADTTAEVAIGQGVAQRLYQVRIETIYDERQLPVGRMVTGRALQESIPQPRFAASETSTRPINENLLNETQPPAAAAAPSGGWLTKVFAFFLPPLLPNPKIPPGVNPLWFQALERAFTAMLRVAAVAGTLQLIFAFFSMMFSPVTLAYAAVTLLIWWVSLARSASFTLRSDVILPLVYALALVEIVDYGYSVEGFTFLLSFVVLAVLLRDLRGGLLAFLIAVFTLGSFGWQISMGNYFPPFLFDEDNLSPASLQAAITSTLAFSAASLALIVAVVSLLRSINLAWQKEIQALNLLQQERDLLEQRVTERTSALAEARDSAETANNELRKYFLAIEQSGSSIVITNVDGDIEYVNPRFEIVTGYTRQEALGKNPRLLKSGKQPREFYTNLWNTISAGNIWQGEFNNRRKDGSLYWEAATIAPVKTPGGAISHYIAIKEDITAEKQLREDLQRQNEALIVSQQEQKALAALLQIGMESGPLMELLPRLLDEILAIRWLGIEAKGGIFLADEETQRLTLTVQRNLSPQIQTLCQQIAFGQCLCGRAALSREIVFAANVDHLHEISYTGMADHGHYNIPILAEGKILGVMVLYLPAGYQQKTSDLTFLQAAANTLAGILQNKRAETLLQESEIRFRQIVENASDLIYRTDALGHFTYANPTALHALGFEREDEVLGRHFLELALPEARRDLKRFYDHQFLARESTTYYEFPALSADGQMVWIGQNVRMVEENGKIIGFQAVARDITALKQARDALALSRDQALEASRFKSQLLAKISHELRTPLAGVIGYAELMEQQAFGALNPEQQDAAENIVTSANYLNTMINELLDQAQIESQSLQLRRAPFSPAELLNQVDGILRPLTKRKALTLTCSLAPDLPATLIGDAQRLQQLLINLGGNAVKFTTQGEIRVELLRAGNARWAMRVSDSGAGIPKEAQEYIFEPFRQVDNAITRNNRGTGLGLSITKQIVEMMGGDIRLESEVGRGSTFTITLPLEEEKETQS
ncbi:MAG: hypothetical protein Fur0035_21670 [Anaerolineales bacterium]